MQVREDQDAAPLLPPRLEVEAREAEEAALAMRGNFLTDSSKMLPKMIDIKKYAKDEVIDTKYPIIYTYIITILNSWKVLFNPETLEIKHNYLNNIGCSPSEDVPNKFEKGKECLYSSVSETPSQDDMKFLLKLVQNAKGFDKGDYVSNVKMRETIMRDAKQEISKLMPGEADPLKSLEDYIRYYYERTEIVENISKVIDKYMDYQSLLLAVDGLNINGRRILTDDERRITINRAINQISNLPELTNEADPPKARGTATKDDLIKYLQKLSLKIKRISNKEKCVRKVGCKWNEGSTKNMFFILFREFISKPSLKENGDGHIIFDFKDGRGERNVSQEELMGLLFLFIYTVDNAWKMEAGDKEVYGKTNAFLRNNIDPYTGEIKEGRDSELLNKYLESFSTITGEMPKDEVYYRGQDITPDTDKQNSYLNFNVSISKNLHASLKFSFYGMGDQGCHAGYNKSSCIKFLKASTGGVPFIPYGIVSQLSRFAQERESILMPVKRVKIENKFIEINSEDKINQLENELTNIANSQSPDILIIKNFCQTREGVSHMWMSEPVEEEQMETIKNNISEVLNELRRRCENSMDKLGDYPYYIIFQILSIDPQGGGSKYTKSKKKKSKRKSKKKRKTKNSKRKKTRKRR